MYRHLISQGCDSIQSHNRYYEGSWQSHYIIISSIFKNFQLKYVLLMRIRNMITSNINNNFMEDTMFNNRAPFNAHLNTFTTLFKHLMVHGRLLNKLIPYNTALRTYNESKLGIRLSYLCHPFIMYMSEFV